jgi:hypothetical protein
LVLLPNACVTVVLVVVM